MVADTDWCFYFIMQQKKLEENIPIQIHESQLAKLARELFLHYSYNFLKLIITNSYF